MGNSSCPIGFSDLVCQAAFIPHRHGGKNSAQFLRQIPAAAAGKGFLKPPQKKARRMALPLKRKVFCPFHLKEYAICKVAVVVFVPFQKFHREMPTKPIGPFTLRHGHGRDSKTLPYRQLPAVQLHHGKFPAHRSILKTGIHLFRNHKSVNFFSRQRKNRRYHRTVNQGVHKDRRQPHQWKQTTVIPSRKRQRIPKHAYKNCREQPEGRRRQIYGDEFGGEPNKTASCQNPSHSRCRISG